MNRLSIIHKIGDLSEQNCRNCKIRRKLVRELPPGNTAPVDHYCQNECDIGIELRKLGGELLTISSSRRESKIAKVIKEEQDMSSVKRGPVPKDAPSCGLTKQIYIEQIASGETNASIERAWGMKANTLYEWIKRWDLKGLKAESAQELLEGKAPLLRSTSPTAKAIEVKAVGLSNLDSQRDAEQVKVLSAKLIDRNAAFDRLLLENKSLQEKLAEERKIVAEVTEDRDQWKHQSNSYREVAYKQGLERNEALQAIVELEDEKRLLLETIEKAATPKTDPNSTYQALVEFGAIQPARDNVNHPIHYTAGGIECIDAIEAALTGLTGGQAYSTGAAIKYLWRWSRKNGLEDLEKAAWYVNRLIGEANVREG